MTKPILGRSLDPLDLTQHLVCQNGDIYKQASLLIITLGQSQNGLDLTNQRHIYFDPRAYGPSSTNIDRRSLKTIITDNLDPSYGGKLENIRPIEVTMLHEARKL